MTLHFIVRLETTLFVTVQKLRKAGVMGVQFNLLYLRAQPVENIIFLAGEFWIPEADFYVIGLWGNCSYWESVV